MAAAEVEHGRRRGTPKSIPSEELVTENPRKGQTLVIPHAEWMRITASLTSTDKKVEEAKARADARKSMHEASKAMVKSWDNTIEGQRQKRLEARKMREEKEEAEKVKIDIEEAKFQANKRKEAIEKARTMVYYQTDRVKTFHGALVLTEVLREREAQLKLKQAKEERSKHISDKYIQVQEQALEQAAQAEREVALQKTKEKDEVARFQLSQISEREKAHKKTREDLLAEQARLEQQAAEYAEQLRKLEADRHQGKLDFRSQLEKHLVEKKALEELDKKQKELEEEGNRLYTEGKKKMTVLRKQKEAELLHELQHTQEKMATLLAQQMVQKSNDENEKIAKAVAEQDAKKAQEEKLKQEHETEQCREISKHRARVMEETERKRQEQLEYDRELLKQRVIQDHKFHTQNQEKQRRRANEAQALQEHHKLQMNEWVAKTEKEKAEELAQMEAHQKILEVEESQFQEYVSKVIEEAETRGAPTQVLKKAATVGAGGGHGGFLTGAFVRPSFKTMDVMGVELPSYQPTRPLSSSIRQRPVDTHKRMGFNA
ncbi:hypothetical protein EMCRGX_G012777 [Ephydatia muelleri]